MQQSKKSSAFLISSIVALFVALILFSILILSSLHKQYYEASFSLESFVSSRFAEKLSQSTKYGIPPHRMAQLDQYVENYQDQTQAYSVLVLDKNANIISAYYYDNETFELPESYTLATRGLVHFEKDDVIWLIQPIVGQQNSLFAQQTTTNTTQYSEKCQELNRTLLANNLLSEGNTVEGYVVHGIKQGLFFNNLKYLIYNNIYTIAIASFMALLLLFSFIYITGKSAKVQKSKYKKVYMYSSLVVPLLLAQMVFILTLYEPMRIMQEKNITNIARQLSLQIAADLEYLENLGIPLKSIGDAKEHFSNLASNFTWLSMIEVHDSTAHVYAINPQMYQDTSPQEQDNIIISLTNKDQEQAPLLASSTIAGIGVVNVYISHQNIQDTMLSILLDIVTIMVITFVFLIEFINVIFMAGETKSEAKPENIEHPRKIESAEDAVSTVKSSIFDNVQIARPITFCNFFCTFLASSFVSLRMAQISPSLFGLSQEITMSLPVSIEMFFVGFSIFCGGFFAKKLGWRTLMLVGGVFVALGNVTSALVMEPLLFIASRCIAGFGYGFLNLAPQLFILAKSKPEHRTQNIASMVSGCYAGLLCSSAFGGLIADRLGFATTFFTASVLMALVTFVLLKYLPKDAREDKGQEKEQETQNTENIVQNSSIKQENMPARPVDSDTTCTPAQSLQTDPTPASSWKALFTFLTNIPMAGLLFMNIMPCAFVSICIFNYYIPVSLNASGASPADIGRVGMFLSLMIVYLSPFFGRIMDKSAHARNTAKVNITVFWLFGAGLIGALSVFTLSLSDSILTAISAVILLGISSAIVYSAQGAYALSLPISKTLDSGKVVAIYNITERAGQVLGPICLGILLSCFGASHSLHIIAFALACMSVLLVASAFYKK